LSDQEKYRLRVFDRRMLMVISGPKKEEETEDQRKLRTQEYCDSFSLTL